MDFFSQKELRGLVGRLEDDMESGNGHPLDEYCCVVNMPKELQEPQSTWSQTQRQLMDEIDGKENLHLEILYMNPPG